MQESDLDGRQGDGRAFVRASWHGHLAAAVLLAILIVGIYGTIAWGMFASSPGFQAHIALARTFYVTGRPPVPHFLFHALTAGLVAVHLTPSLLLAGRLVIAGCYVLIALEVYGLLWMLFGSTRIGRPPILFLLSLAALLAEPITLAHAYALGYLWPEPYEIPTSTLLKPFALASFAGTAWYLTRRGKTDARLLSVFAFSTLAGSLSKQVSSFACFPPRRCS